MYEESLYGRTNKLTIEPNPAIILDSNEVYFIGVSGGFIPIVMPNITAVNNTVHMSNDAGVTWIDVIIPEGRYDLVDIQDYLTNIQRETTGFIVSGGDTEDHYDDIPGITLSYDAPSNKTSVYLRPNFRFDVGTMGKLLGFSNDTIIDTERIKQYSPVAPQVDQFVYYQITCDLAAQKRNPINSRYVSSILMDAPHENNQPESIPFNNKISWVQMKNASVIDNITVSLVDENLNPLDTRGEMMMIKIKIVHASMVSM